MHVRVPRRGRSSTAVLAFLVSTTLIHAQDALAPSSPTRPDLKVGGFVNGSDERAAFTKDELIVRFRSEVDPEFLRHVGEVLGFELADRGRNGAFEVLRVPAELVDVWATWLAAQPEVELVERNALCHTTAAPNDPLYAPYQWNFLNRGALSNGRVSNHGVQAEAAWPTSTGSSVVVAVVDTGVAYETYGGFAQAPDLAGRSFVSPYNAITGTTHANDDNGHGTHVAGTIGQSTNNGLGVAGIAYGCSIMPVKVLNSAGSGSHAQIANGITWAADHGAKVINLSLGGSTGSTTLSNAITYAWGRGVVICAATGNTGRSGVSYPARYTNCIAVGATRFDGNRSGYSTYGTGIDVVAPGGDTSVDQNGDGYGDGILQQTFATGAPTTFSYYFFQGTSMATPHVAAIAALVIAHRPTYTNTQVRSAIESSCQDRGSAGYDTRYGNGLVDAAAALTR
ncbi:MAG: peptidase S8 [Planctomycetes bacterium]|nr:peptidase S8 [Planctomycetota bacterium]